MTVTTIIPETEDEGGSFTVSPTPGMQKKMEDFNERICEQALAEGLACMVITVVPGQAQVDIEIGAPWSAIIVDQDGHVQLKAPRDQLTSEQLIGTVAVYDMLAKILQTQALEIRTLCDEFSEWAGVEQRGDGELQPATRGEDPYSGR